MLSRVVLLLLLMFVLLLESTTVVSASTGDNDVDDETMKPFDTLWEKAFVGVKADCWLNDELMSDEILDKLVSEWALIKGELKLENALWFECWEFVRWNWCTSLLWLFGNNLKTTNLLNNVKNVLVWNIILDFKTNILEITNLSWFNDR